MTGSALSASQDQVLEAFIALVRQNSDLKAQIKAALNQDQVIEIAAANGFDIDSSAILRKWSKHTDFTQDTWMGWFEE
ncbi:Nif11-like leader peptide family natural product precursor [Synechococcus sp. CC9605]|jgi:predicted ribosomally synthesized peptide with nif11-like leader|uniref:Nif11-like leader peptide family natural product precursor n=1 Tax=Synechococcus sp. (strain CC9605) TaxID=110662 RepID=UPI0008FF76A5|nr:Nif11-like leader peptide family natural product precursor [Synechococcus sp. CC9605]|tara:strand:- start:2923 stop:3156 length:234 start_codon:yes stop_codon:yes gene_type:complete